MWMRGTHTLASLAARFLARFGVFRGMCNPYYRICIPPRLRGLWILLELVSIAPIIIARLVLPRLVGRVVVAERSPLDLLAWLSLTLRDAGVVFGLFGRIMASISLRLCDFSLYIRADRDTLISRRLGSGEEGLVAVELVIYDAIAGLLGLPTLDTTGKSVGVSFRELLGILGMLERNA